MGPDRGLLEHGRVNASETYQELSVDEVIALYPREWVLMRVTEDDDDGFPAKGLVLAHSPRRDDISDALEREPPRAELPPDAPPRPYYIFRAFPRIRADSNDPRYAEAVHRFVDQLRDALRARGRR